MPMVPGAGWAVAQPDLMIELKKILYDAAYAAQMSGLSGQSGDAGSTAAATANLTEMADKWANTFANTLAPTLSALMLQFNLSAGAECNGLGLATGPGGGAVTGSTSTFNSGIKFI